MPPLVVILFKMDARLCFVGGRGSLPALKPNWPGLGALTHALCMRMPEPPRPAFAQGSEQGSPALFVAMSSHCPFGTNQNLAANGKDGAASRTPLLASADMPPEPGAFLIADSQRWNPLGAVGCQRKMAKVPWG